MRTPLLPALLLSCCALSLFPAAHADDDAAMDELRAFAEAFERIRTFHVDSPDEARLIEGAIRGMLAELDADSAYLDASAFQALRDLARGRFGGIGIEVHEHSGRLQVIAPMDHSPAHAAGILPGDLIETIDGEPVAGMTVDEATSSLRGEPGSSVTLELYRPASSERLELELVREVIEIPSVSAQLLTSEAGYLRIGQFQRHSLEHVRGALQSLQDNVNDKLKGLILDLRNNPGGPLQAAVDVAGLFLDEALIVTTRGRSEDSVRMLHSDAGKVMVDMPVIVLVNEGSASAAEILAAALRDHQRAVLLGTRTFGKGSVQTLLPLRGERGLKLTTARYHSPAGTPIDARGLNPDITISLREPLQPPLSPDPYTPLLLTEVDSTGLDDPQLRAALDWLQAEQTARRDD